MATLFSSRNSLRPGEFFGECLATRQLAGASLVEARYPRGLEIQPHTHEQPYFCLVVAGGYREWLGGGCRICPSGIAIYHPAGERHADAFTEHPARLFMMEPGVEWRRSSKDWNLPVDRRIECPAGPLRRLLAGIYDEFSTHDESSPIVVEGLLLEIAGAMKRIAAGEKNRRRPPGWLERCRERLHAAQHEPLRLHRIAAEEGVSPVDLARGFRRFFRCTPGEYLRGLRVQAACALLRDSRLPISQIALECGFSSQSHLSTVLRKATGRTPGALRRENP